MSSSYGCEGLSGELICVFLQHLVWKIIIILEWCFQIIFKESSHQNHLGTNYKYTFLGSGPDSLNKSLWGPEPGNLHFREAAAVSAMCTQTWQTMSLRLYFFTDCTQVSSVSLWGKIYTLRPRETELSADQFSSVIQSCPTLCDPMDISIPGHPVHHQLPEFTGSKTHTHWVSDAVQPSHPLLSPSLPALNLSEHQDLFKWVSSSPLGGQRIGASA